MRLFACLCVILLVAACGGETPSATDTAVRAGNDIAASSAAASGATSAQEAWPAGLPRPEWSQFTRVLPDTEWFEIYTVAPRIHAIYEPRHFEEVISYLIEGDDFAVLFDTGLGIGDIKAVVDQLTARQLIVINSHGHYDHVGGNHQFPLIAALDNDFARERAGGARGDKIREMIAPEMIAGDFPSGFRPFDYEIRPWTASSTIADGDVIDLGGIALEVMQLPGHSPDALALLDRENRRLFVGDIYYDAPLYAHLEGSDLAAYGASAARLAALAPDIDTLYTAHNVPTADGSVLERLAAAFATIQRGEGDFRREDDVRRYRIDGFTILTPDKPFGRE